MKKIIYLFVVIIGFTSCNSFEAKYYEQVKTVYFNNSDIFDLTAVTDFQWDSVLIVRGNESVPVFKELIDESLNRRESLIHWEERRFKNVIDTSFRYRVKKDIPTNKDRFYFLTPDKTIIEKTMSHKANWKNDIGYWIHYDREYKFEGYWLSKEECKFKVKKTEEWISLYPQFKDTIPTTNNLEK